MGWLYWGVPLMVIAVIIATLPILIAMRNEEGDKQRPRFRWANVRAAYQWEAVAGRRSRGQAREGAWTSSARKWPDEQMPIAPDPQPQATPESPEPQPEHSSDA